VTRIAAALAALLLATPVRAYGPETNYAIHCQGCHLADGAETPGKVPGLVGQVALFLRTPDGRAYLGRVPGVANAPLSDTELAALLNWTLRRFDAAHVPPDFAPYTAEEIGSLRRHPLVEVTRERARIVEARP
jgi:hypothetical protein